MTDLMQTYKKPTVTFESGSGATLVDTEGRTYIDMVAGIAVASVGHSHPRVVEAIQEQASRLIHVSNLYGSGPQAALAAKLSSLTGGMKSFFCNSGAEAVESALKLARARDAERGRRGKVVAFDGAFHGRTFGALSATGQPGKKVRFEPLLEGFVHIPFGDVDALQTAVDDSVSAVIVEPIQGEGGVVVPPADFLPALRRRCDAVGALLIVDEVQTGLARTGKWFAYEHSDVVPDIVCLAKALGGGLPIGACLARPQVADAFVVGDHASTFGGGPVQCAAALAVLDVIEQEDLVTRAGELGETLMKELETVFAGAEVRGRGLLIGVELGEPVAPEIARRAQDRGLLVNAAGDRVVRLSPPLVIDEREVERGIAILREVADDLGAA